MLKGIVIFPPFHKTLHDLLRVRAFSIQYPPVLAIFNFLPPCIQNCVLDLDQWDPYEHKYSKVQKSGVLIIR